MPTYCYKDDRGRVHERVFPIMAQIPKEIVTAAGKVAKRCYQAERASVPASSGWPMTCYASGVNAAQAAELRAHLASKGVPTEVTKDGDPVYLNAKHRRKALKARGMFDKSSYV